MRWLGHVVRVEDDTLPKIMLFGQLQNYTRPMGRPLLRYKDKLKHNVDTLGLGVKKWEKTCLDRSEWRTAFYQSITKFEDQRLAKMVVNRRDRKGTPQDSSIGSTFSCSLCSKRCKSNAGLKLHMRSHAQQSCTTSTSPAH